MKVAGFLGSCWFCRPGGFNLGAENSTEHPQPYPRPVMNTPGAKANRPWTPELYAQQAHAPSAKLPDDDLVFFLVDVVPKLDLSRIHAPYQDETRGAPPFDPAMMTCLLLYAYCVGVFSSRKIAQACERNLAFLAIVGDQRPDFRTISLFRKDHLEAFADVFVQVLRLAKTAGLVRLGTIAVDGTKVQGNASRHKAMSYGYMTKEVDRLRAEIDELLKQAQDVDAQDDAALGARRGDELPEDLRRRQDRLATIEAAMKQMQAKLKTPAGRAVYARRKAIVEPVFGQIKEARGFRRFLLRGLDKIRGEWRLVCLTHNLLKIWRYGRGILDGSPCAVVEGRV